MANLIVQENSLPGNPSTQWDLSGAGSTNIEGFSAEISVNRGETVDFKIDTDSTNWRIDIYRLGYYAGNGARKVATLLQTAASNQPDPLTNNEAIGLVDAGNWFITVSWAVPANAVSGVYLAHLVRQDSVSGENHIPFVVRDDGVQHDLVFQTSDPTWHAYNGWGGYSLYGGTTAESDGRAYKVSYNRPIATRDGVGLYAGPQDSLFGEEIAAIHWLEANGYDVCYMAGVDTDRRGSEILNHKVFLSVGHDEYWSSAQRANVEAARAAGIHLAFWSGNEVFWKTRWEPSTDASATPYRTLVCYKETRDNAVIDPNDPPTCTCTWRDPRFTPPGDAGRPENALTGTIFMVDDFREDQILIPYAMTKLRFWRNCPLASTPSGQSGKLVKNYLGYEWDESPDNGFRPPGLIRLSLTTLSVDTYLLDYGTLEGPGIATHSLTLYRDPTSHALVFGAGTVMWSWGLDPNHDPDPKDTTQTPVDPNVKQAMVNLLADMGVFAGSLQSGLVPATQSTDTTPPTGTQILTPANNASIPQNQTVTISGTTLPDVGGLVAVVEVSTDSGTTWHPATGTGTGTTPWSTWSYSWTPSLSGLTTIIARAVDDSINIESSGPSVTVTVSGATGATLFGATTPGVVAVADPNPVELGVKFQSSQAGTITALRFYKGAQNTGTHTATLWSSTGSMLTTTSFTGESASGWQQVNLVTPVPITAGTLYVASYHTAGNYSADSDYFDTVAHTSGPLTAPATGTVAGNGVYVYGAGGIFPTSTFAGSNYWVDVVFNAGGTVGNQPPVANNDSGFVTTLGSPLTLLASQLLANDTDPNGSALSLATVGTPVNGSVILSGQTVIFTPAATGPASFTYTIKDALGLSSAPATVSLTVNPVAANKPPVANNDSGFFVTLGTPLSILASQLLANDTDPNGSALSIATVGTPVNGGVILSGQTVIFTATAVGPASFTYTIKDALGLTSAPATVSLTVNAAGSTTASLFTPTTVPGTITDTDPNAVELGVKFQSSLAGRIIAIRFYKGPNNTGTHTAHLWSATGTSLATGTFTGETASGWQQFNLATPVAIKANTVYVASYHVTKGAYSADNNYFASAHVSGVLTAPAGTNGVYTYGTTSKFPTSTYNASNYYVDVVFVSP
jgi:N,N-dimethylformamidase beta subunit-like protein/uncharacterized protein DUF4082/Big-like domain-containing protein